MTNNQLLTNIFVIIFFHFILAQFAVLDCFFLYSYQNILEEKNLLSYGLMTFPITDYSHS